MHALRTDLTDGYIARYDDGDFGSWPMGSSLPTRSASTRMKSSFTSSRRPAVASHRLRDEGEGDVHARDFRAQYLGTGMSRTTIAFDTYGNLWGTLSCCSDRGYLLLTPKADLRNPARRREPDQGGGAGARRSAERSYRGCAVRDRAGGRALDVERYVRRSQSANRLHRFTSRYTIPYFRAPVTGRCDGALA